MTDTLPNRKTHPPANAVDVEEALEGDEEGVLPPNAEAIGDDEPSRYVAPGEGLSDS